MKKLLVVTGDSLGKLMAGPAIRAIEMATALSSVAEVRLATTVPTSYRNSSFEVCDVSDSSLRHLVEWADIILFQGALLSTDPWICKTDKILVSDLYDPMHIENLEQQRLAPEGSRYIQSLDIVSVMNEQLARADFFLCASEKQRDFWLGQLAAVGRLNPLNYSSDTSLRNLIDVVPFGVQNTDPFQSDHGIRNVIDGISEEDKVILWGGGIYNWFDPLTLIRALAIISKSHKDIRLVFMGTQHPNPHVPEMKMSFDARELSQQLGLLNKHVFFNEGWVPYEDRANFLLDADLGVSTHLDHLETAFSFRTRILDYLWAGLPIVATGGDTFESIINEFELGKTVEPGNPQMLAEAITSILYFDKEDSNIRNSVRKYSEKLRWQVVLKPLIQFIENPKHAADFGSNFSESVSKMSYFGRRTVRQRALMFSLNSKKIGFNYAVSLFAKNSFGKIYRKIKRILNIY